MYHRYSMASPLTPKPFESALRKFDTFEIPAGFSPSSKLLEAKITDGNYAHRFHQLLWMEELEKTNTINILNCTSLVSELDLQLTVEVPQLPNSHGLLEVYDKITLQSCSQLFEGRVLKFQGQTVWFKLLAPVDYEEQLRDIVYDVSFAPLRLKYIQMHLELEKFTFIDILLESPVWRQRMHDSCLRYYRNVIRQANRLARTLVFPGPLGRDIIEYRYLTFVDRADEKLRRELEKDLNERQIHGFYGILESGFRPAPYLICGGPRTGKTWLIAHAIKHICALNKRARILVCSDTDSSVDSMVELIKKPGSSTEPPSDGLLRLISTRGASRLLLNNDQEEFRLTVCEKEEAEHLWVEHYPWRVTASTHLIAGFLHEIGLKFDYVFIDNSHNLTEPQTLVPLGLMKQDGGCVLAGVPSQRSAHCLSSAARKHELDLSMLDRIILTRQDYKDQAGRLLNRELLQRYIIRLDDVYPVEDVL